MKQDTDYYVVDPKNYFKPPKPHQGMYQAVIFALVAVVVFALYFLGKIFLDNGLELKFTSVTFNIVTILAVATLTTSFAAMIGTVWFYHKNIDSVNKQAFETWLKERYGIKMIHGRFKKSIVSILDPEVYNINLTARGIPIHSQYVYGQKEEGKKVAFEVYSDVKGLRLVNLSTSWSGNPVEIETVVDLSNKTKLSEHVWIYLDAIYLESLYKHLPQELCSTLRNTTNIAKNLRLFPLNIENQHIVTRVVEELMEVNNVVRDLASLNQVTENIPTVSSLLEKLHNEVQTIHTQTVGEVENNLQKQLNWLQSSKTHVSF